jgi:hypothetical protein
VFDVSKWSSGCTCYAVYVHCDKLIIHSEEFYQVCVCVERERGVEGWMEGESERRG